MSFLKQVKDRRWFISGDGQTTHLLMDGSGKLSIPDSFASTFLNIYFAAVIVRGERLSVVEQKSPVFRLFFDLDIRVTLESDMMGILRRLVMVIWNHVTRDFFILETSDTSTDSSESQKRDRMIVCTAPPKDEGQGVVKVGCHLVFPNIFVNSPIALRCREVLLETLDVKYHRQPSRSTSAHSVTQSCAEDSIESIDPTLDEPVGKSPSGIQSPVNSWRDVVDDSVYKGSGLRMIYSAKGRHETRVYTPLYDMTSVDGFIDVQCDSLAAKRDYVHDCSIRTSVAILTPCRGGEHQIADDLFGQMRIAGSSVSGKSQSIDMYSDAIPVIEESLPAMYKGIRFLKAFVTPSTVYLKTNSRYCLNVRREHRTSTIYIAVSKVGMSVRCYSRKEEYCCSSFASPVIPLPARTLRVFFPDSFSEPETSTKPMFQSTKRRRVSSHSILHANPLFRM